LIASDIEKPIQLVFHPMLGKTATTWLQTFTLQKLYLVNLGKGGKADGSEDF